MSMMSFLPTLRESWGYMSRLKFIWGAKSYDDLSGDPAGLYTTNDIDIIYDRKEDEYILGIDTGHRFDSSKEECEYLQSCLNAFTKFMDDNGLDKNEPYCFFMHSMCTCNVTKSIEELYTNFKIFVDGYCCQYANTKK